MLASIESIPAPDVVIRTAPFPVIADLSDFSPCDGTAKLRVNPLVAQSEPVITDEEYWADMPLMMNSWKAMFEEFEDGDASRLIYATVMRRTTSGTPSASSSVAAAVCGRSSGLTGLQVLFQLSARSPSIGRLVT